jgi:hypothetical protein
MRRQKQSEAKNPARSSRVEGGVARVVITNVNVPGKSSRVNADKYEGMRRALLAVLPTKVPGLTQAEMFKAVLPLLPVEHFPGGAKANWWAKTVQLDLEAKGIVVRENTKPLRWHRS